MMRNTMPDLLKDFIVEVAKGETKYTRQLHSLFKNLIAAFLGSDYADDTANSLKQTEDFYGPLAETIKSWNKSPGSIKNTYLRNLCFPTKNDPTHPKQINRLVTIFDFFTAYFSESEKTVQYWVDYVTMEFNTVTKNYMELVPIEVLSKTNFRVIEIPVNASTSAERFYNGFIVTYEDLKAQFDFQRSVYSRKNGIKDTIQGHLTSTSPFVILIKGAAGTGKKTLLKRIGYDLAEANKIAYELDKDWIFENKNTKLQAQILSLLEEQDDVCFLIDDVAECVLKNEINFDSLFLKCQNKKVLFIITEHPYQWGLIKDAFSQLFSEPQNYSSFPLTELTDDECENLVDKMIYLENNGHFLTVKNLNFSKVQRLKICIESARRHLLVVMFETRYGRKFSEIIVNEFNKIPTAIAKEAYLNVCFWQKWRMAFPELLFIQTLSSNSVLNLKDVISGTQELLLFSRNGVSARHIVIAREMYRVFFDHKIQVYTVLKNLFSLTNQVDSDMKKFLIHFLHTEEIHREVSTELARDTELIYSLIDIIKKCAFIYDDSVKVLFLTFHGSIERILNNDEGARDLYSLVVTKYDTGHLFSYRQLAWIEQDNQNFDQAIGYANKVYELSNADAENLLHVARIYALNTIQNFKTADFYYALALQKSDYDKKIYKEYEKYQSSAKVLSYLVGLDDNNLIPEEIIIQLRPSKRFIKECFGVSSRHFKNKILNILHGIEDKSTGTIDELMEVIDGYDIERDRLVGSKFYSNLARLTYIEWHKSNGATDTSGLLGIFQESIKLNFDDPFTHCWLGTYYKEIAKDYTKAKDQYRIAIDLSYNATHYFDKNHPIFPNNMALLIMENFILRKANVEELMEAETLLVDAVQMNKVKELDFFWAEDNLVRCRYLIKTYLNIDKS